MVEAVLFAIGLICWLLLIGFIVSLLAMEYYKEEVEKDEMLYNLRKLSHVSIKYSATIYLTSLSNVWVRLSSN